jgi:hypothetical protein
MTVEDLKKKALRLSPELRAYLARELLTSLDSMNDDETKNLWLDEAVRRDEDLDTGRASSRPASEVLKSARARRK